MRNLPDSKELVDVFDVLEEGETEEFLEKAQSKLSTLVNHVIGDNRAVVKSAVPLTSNEKSRIETLLAKLTGHTLKVYFHDDVSLLGGIQVTIGDWKLDGSLLHQLTKLKNQILL